MQRKIKGLVYKELMSDDLSKIRTGRIVDIPIISDLGIVVIERVVKNICLGDYLPKEFIKMYWSLADDGYEQLMDAYKVWKKKH